MRRFIEILFLVAGLAGVGIFVWSHVRLSISQKQANRTLQRELSTRPSAPEPVPPKLTEGALVGKLVIPRLNLQSVVREGAGEETLGVGAGHIPGTALPGQRGNVGIAGHRDTIFRRLRGIQENDLLQLETPGGTFNYQVENTRIVKPTDVDVLRAGAQPELTLVTCYPFYYVGPAPDRFIVKARLVDGPSMQPVDSKTMLAAARRATRKASVKVPPGRLTFQVSEHHTSTVAPGIMIGLYWADVPGARASGWIWVAPEPRRIWLWNQSVNQPLVFRSQADGKQRELVLTSVTKNSAAGYVQQ